MTACLGVHLVIEARRLHLFRKRDKVGRRRQAPVLMRPELAGGGHTGLHLVHDKGRAVPLGARLHAAEKGGRRRVVAALALDRLAANRQPRRYSQAIFSQEIAKKEQT